jgi:hypothetical protein
MVVQACDTATQEVEIRSITVQGQPSQKVVATPISINELGIVENDSHSSYAEEIDRRITV